MSDLDEDPQEIKIKTKETKERTSRLSKTSKYSKSSNLNTKNYLWKITVPYNFSNNTYSLQESIDYCDQQEYIKRRLNEYSNDPLFHMDHEYQFTKIEKVSSYIPNAIVTIVLVYLLIFILSNCFFNPGIFLFSIVLIFKIYFILDEKRFIKGENRKINKINDVLKKENKSQFCVENSLSWVLGMNGYWIEIYRLK